MLIATYHQHPYMYSNHLVNPEPKRRFIAQSRSCLPFHRLEMTEILLKGRKTLTHPSIRLVKLYGQHNNIH